MEIPKKTKIPVSDADRQKSYFKYYEREAAAISPEKAGKIFGPPMDRQGKLTFPERARILDAGFEDETGYCVLADGTGYISDTTFIPGGTAEMVDWYFAWRGLDPFRFAIIQPEENLSAMSMQTGIVCDPFRTVREKYWDTTQEIKRLGERGAVQTEYLNFKCPSGVGFDMTKIGPDKETKTLVCARNFAEGQPPMAPPDYFICHQVKEAEGGIRVISRIWYGWTVRYGKDYKALPDEFFMQPMVPKTLMIRNAAEWANLAAILPSLYAEEKDTLQEVWQDASYKA